MRPRGEKKHLLLFNCGDYIIAIAEMAPGPLGTNCATFAGMRVAGIPGALAANLGVLTPTFTVCFVVGAFFECFRDSKPLAHAMMDVRPVCFGIIWAVILNLCQTNYFSPSGIDGVNAGIGVLAACPLMKRKDSRCDP